MPGGVILTAGIPALPPPPSFSKLGTACPQTLESVHATAWAGTGREQRGRTHNRHLQAVFPSAGLGISGWSSCLHLGSSLCLGMVMPESWCFGSSSLEHLNAGKALEMSACDSEMGHMALVSALPLLPTFSCPKQKKSLSWCCQQGLVSLGIGQSRR